MEYIDGYVAAVPTKNKDRYIKMAEEISSLFREHGAIRVVECWGDEVPPGKKTSFPLAVQCQEDETVIFSWIAWPSREARNIGMMKVMQDVRMKPGSTDSPFDGSRMIFGGFQVVLDR